MPYPQPSVLFEPLTLPNGTTLPNRIVKAPTEENLADRQHLPGPALIRLYPLWADARPGLIITGNVMIDRRAMTAAADVVLDAHQPLAPFREWARSARPNGGQVWMQLNHPGRQIPRNLKQPAFAPSAVPMEFGRLTPMMFPPPQALTHDEIEEVIERFSLSASLAEQAGFDGVELHGAHGYLISQFLSPRTNQRDDEWGGDEERRARFLLRIIKAIRERVSRHFSLGLKLNSTDFQKGGFELAAATNLIRSLNELKLDLIEISGGTYESPTAMNVGKPASSLRREAYYVDFARAVSRSLTIPLLVTGGITSRSIAEQVIRPAGASTVDLIGVATAMVFDPALPENWRASKTAPVRSPTVLSKSRLFSVLAEGALARERIRGLSTGCEMTGSGGPWRALILDYFRSRLRVRRYRKWMSRPLPKNIDTSRATTNRVSHD